MDENVLLQTLNATLQRHAKQIGNYEIEVANLTAENIRIQNEFELLKVQKEELESRLAAMLESNANES